MSEESEKTPADADAPKAQAGDKPKKKKARAEAESTEQIRDRNKRIREEAAQKRKARREGDRPARPAGLDASEMMDDAFARTTHVAAGWLKRNMNIIQWVVVIGAAAGIGWQIYAHQRKKSAGAGADSLMAGIFAETARVGDEDKGEPDPRTGLTDLRRHFAKDEERLTAAASAYRAVSGSAEVKLLGRLGLAGVLFDQGKYKEALAEYRAVRESSLAAEDSDVRGRSAEGIGLSEEALKNNEGALKAFRELGNMDIAAFSALGLYHQARIAHQQKDLPKAKELLNQALKKLERPKGSTSPAGYTEQIARELLAVIDPSSAATTPQSLSPEQLEALTRMAGGDSEGEGKKKLEELMRQAMEKLPIAPSGAPAPAPAPAPASSGASPSSP